MKKKLEISIQFLVLQMKKKEVLKKYAELWDEIKNEIETINCGKAGKYGKDFIKTKFDRER